MSRTPFHALHTSATRVALLCLTVLACATLSSAQAQSWPQRPIKLVVPASAGGTVDRSPAPCRASWASCSASR